MSLDYSFLRLKDSLESARDMQDSPVVTHYFYNPIQLLPNKSYLQITNYQGGISLDNNCEVFVVDCNDNVLADITDNVFIEEFTDGNGNNQCKIEYINLGVDFYRETVLIKFSMLNTNAVWWTNPINITAYESEKTIFFKYKNFDDFMGIGYTNANAWQSISLSLYFDIPLDETESEDYFQISKNNTISARALQKVFEQYRIDRINRFTFDRLNVLLKHNLIYLDDIRVTNKPTVTSAERQGDSNFFESDLIVAKNYSDISFYDFQIYTGLEYLGFAPEGLYITGTSFTDLKVSFNEDVTLNTGSITVYNSEDTIVETFTESDMTIVGGNSVNIDLSGTSLASPSNDTYYVHITSGLVTGVVGLENNEAIYDDTTWVFTLRDADFLGTDFNNSDFFTN
jgi:hypothetical protein